MKSLYSKWILVSCILIPGVQLNGAQWTESLKRSFAEAENSHEWVIRHYSSEILQSKHLNLNYVGLEYRYLWDFQELEDRSGWAVYLSGEIDHPYDGPGSYMFGGAIGARWKYETELGYTTYVQISSGIIGNDVYEKHNQNSIGGFLEFRTNFSVGISKKMGHEQQSELHLEVGVEHISNASIYSRNAGLNLAGLALAYKY